MAVAVVVVVMVVVAVVVVAVIVVERAVVVVAVVVVTFSSVLPVSACETHDISMYVVCTPCVRRASCGVHFTPCNMQCILNYL